MQKRSIKTILTGWGIVSLGFLWVYSSFYPIIKTIVAPPLIKFHGGVWGFFEPLLALATLTIGFSFLIPNYSIKLRKLGYFPFFIFLTISVLGGLWAILLIISYIFH